MGKLYGSSAPLSQTFTFNGNAPIDDRIAVKSIDDLQSINAYKGLFVFVEDENEYFGQVQILTDTLIKFTNKSINMVKEIIVLLFHYIFNKLKVSFELTFNFLYIQKFNKYKKNC